jgi:predicted alpha-1,2-mannosidase
MKNSLVAFIVIAVLTNCSVEKLTDIKSKDVLQYVNPFIGTGFHGHTFPGAVVPHGRVQLSPDTHLMGWDASSGYHYDDTTLFGFSHTHLSGTGIGDLGDILFLPFSGDIPAEKPVGNFDHQNEEASPGYYSVLVEPWKVKSELTVTKRTGWHRYSFPQNTSAKLMIDLGHVLQPNWGHQILEGEIRIVDEYAIEGYRLTSGWAAYDPIHFKCTFNHPIISHEIKVDENLTIDKEAKGTEVIAFLGFAHIDSPLEAKVSISSVDSRGASINLTELDHFQSFDEVVKAAENAWREELSKIVIETSDESVLVNFYTALYHTKIAPILFTDLDGRYLGMDQQIHQSSGIERHSAYSLWDTFRSWHPLMTVIDPERSKKWAIDLYMQSLEGGLLPKWPLNGNYTGTMVGYPAAAILADVFQKGILDTIPDKILESTIKNSTWQQDFYDQHQGTRAAGVMPMHIYYKEELGFVPIDKCRESVSYGLEMAYYDWCVSQLAEVTGNSEVENNYKVKGNAYQKYFDKDLNFMRGINSNGTWDANFNPRYSSHEESEFVEGNSYQWTPFVPHDPEGLANLMGGKEQFGIWLDTLFYTSSELVGENVSGDISGLIGQYAHGNEPSHHIPYLYRYTDRPWRTEEVLDTILCNFYLPTPDGIIGNEDCGQMSAWYVLNALGIYQLAPGNPEFLVGRPIVEKAKIRVNQGWFEIKVTNNSRENKYVKEVKLDSKILQNSKFLFSEIRAGSTLEIVMTDQVND